MADQPIADNSVAVNANSSANAGNSNTVENGVFLDDSSLHIAEEFGKDKNQDHSGADNKFSASVADDLQSNSNGAAGTDRKGTFERKPFGDTELNKGLEAQAMDAEGS